MQEKNKDAYLVKVVAVADLFGSIHLTIFLWFVFNGSDARRR